MHELAPANTSSGLQRYDPEKGLLALAAAEAAHKHFARAKNLDGLSQAIEAKLKEQRNFVLWWDRMGEKRGSGPSQRCRRSSQLCLCHLLYPWPHPFRQSLWRGKCSCPWQRILLSRLLSDEICRGIWSGRPRRFTGTNPPMSPARNESGICCVPQFGIL